MKNLHLQSKYCKAKNCFRNFFNALLLNKGNQLPHTHNPEICKELLEQLLQIKIDHEEYPKLQETINSYYDSKGVRLDVYVKDSKRVFDIEIQNSVDITLPKRTRYYQSMLDIDNLLKGEEYSELKESFIIFICQFDLFGLNLPQYTFKNICLENKELPLGDETTKIFFNSFAYDTENNLEISAFLKYINTKIPTNDFTKKLNNLVEESKINNKFRNDYLAMNLHDRDIRRVALAEGKQIGLQEGLTKGAEQTKIETAKNFIQKNIPLETIEECTGLSLEKVQELANREQD